MPASITFFLTVTKAPDKINLCRMIGKSLSWLTACECSSCDTEGIVSDSCCDRLPCVHNWEERDMNAHLFSPYYLV